MNKRRENCFNIREWEEETGHEDRSHTHTHTHTHTRAHTHTHTRAHTHTHTHKHTHSQRGAKGIKEKEGYRIKT